MAANFKFFSIHDNLIWGLTVHVLVRTIRINLNDVLIFKIVVSGVCTNNSQVFIIVDIYLTEFLRIAFMRLFKIEVVLFVGNCRIIC
jgi:hypothetical protein